MTHRVIPAFITATIVPIRFPSSSASLRLRARPVPLRSPSQREYLNSYTLLIPIFRFFIQPMSSKLFVSKERNSR
ncbi:MAG: hypothetical protein [Olavius algarvensis Gamma 1 endosymbiont]|nr:MAG: hypothetical protein [Olavius algarvensis Gamma 1 endosymbiont]